MRRSVLRALQCWLLALLAPASAGLEPARVVVDEVAPGSEIEKAGLQEGDVLHSWERMPAPPANPSRAQGSLESPFDWMWLEVEQANRGTVVLSGERHGEPKIFTVAAGEWNVHFNSEKRGRSRTRPLLPTAAEALYLRGLEAIRRGRRAEGLALWRRLPERLPGVEDNLARCWLGLRIGESWGEEGEWERAEEAFREASACSAARARVFLAEAHGKSLEYQGRFRAAAESYQTALELRQATEPDSLAVARSLHQIASQEYNLGNLAAAERLWRPVLALRTRQAPGSFLEADSLQTQSLLAADRGDLEAAEHFMKRSVDIQRRLAPESFWMAFKLTTLADVYIRRGDLDVAERHVEEALRIRQLLVPDGESVATGMIRLGRLKLDRGHYPEARPLFTQALDILGRVFPDHPTSVTAWNHLGDLALATGQLDEAERSFRAALGFLARVVPGRPWAADSWAGLAQAQFQRGDLDAARHSFQQALAIHRRLATGTDGEARAEAGLGHIARRLGKLDEANRHLRAAIGALEAQVGRLGGSQDVKAEFRALRLSVYSEAATVELERGNREAAFDIQESARAQSFLALLADRDLATSDAVPPELEVERRRVGLLFRRALAALASTPGAGEERAAERAARDLPLLREQLDAIAAQIKSLAPRSSTLHFPQALSAAEVARELDPGTTLLAYQVSERETSIFVLPWQGRVEAVRAPVGAAELERALARFRAAREQPGLRGGQEWQRPMRELYDWLVKPVEALLAPASRILILPDGPLHALPWGALVRQESSATGEQRAQFFVEWKSFSKALSATVWAELKARRRTAPGAGTGACPNAGDGSLVGAAPRGCPPEIAAFGDPLRREVASSAASTLAASRLERARHRGLAFTPLPSSRREVEGIAHLFPGEVATYLGAEATEEKAKALARSLRIVHFATHGFADERFPLSSGLVLAQPARLDDHGEEPGEDGLLQAWEILERVRLDADLVVLSACETGLGKDAGGEGLLSLTRAFQYAGARAVVASLWKVGDEATADLILRFYRHFKGGSATADALRAAQLETLASQADGEAPNPDPAGWAAFEVFGDGG